MPTFVMTTRLAAGALRSPQMLEDLEKRVVERLRGECPEVQWSASYAVMGPFDYLDIFEAPDTDAAIKVSTLVRTFGHAHTEVWPASGWQQFKDIIRTLPPGEG
jgi:uncharacterized protein with GYD domain